MLAPGLVFEPPVLVPPVLVPPELVVVEVDVVVEVVVGVFLVLDAVVVETEAPPVVLGWEAEPAEGPHGLGRGAVLVVPGGAAAGWLVEASVVSAGTVYNVCIFDCKAEW